MCVLSSYNHAVLDPHSTCEPTATIGTRKAVRARTSSHLADTRHSARKYGATERGRARKACVSALPRRSPNPNPNLNPNQVLQSVQLPFAMLPVLHFTA